MTWFDMVKSFRKKKNLCKCEGSFIKQKYFTDYEKRKQIFFSFPKTENKHYSMRLQLKRYLEIRKKQFHGGQRLAFKAETTI